MNLKSALKRTLPIGSMLFFLCFGLPAAATAESSRVSLRWDHNQPAPEGYRIFARRSDQAYDYTRPDWEGTANSCTIDLLEDQTEYFFVVRAFDGYLESLDSEEVHYVPPLRIDPGLDTTAPYWNGATLGIGLAAAASTGNQVVVEFDTAWDAVDRGDLLFNVYYAPQQLWDDRDWGANSVLAGAAVGPGDTFTHAVVIDGLINGVGYIFGVRAEDRSGNEDRNTSTLPAAPVFSFGTGFIGEPDSQTHPFGRGRFYNEAAP